MQVRAGGAEQAGFLPLAKARQNPLPLQVRGPPFAGAPGGRSGRACLVLHFALITQAEGHKRD